MAAKKILAVAIGSSANDTVIDNGGDLSKVRHYITGLIEGLKASPHDQQIGKDYVIDYRECDEGSLGRAFASASDAVAIFCMSTTVVGAAKTFTDKIPILGVVSEPKVHGFDAVSNVGGISARRSQTAGECFVRFLATVPGLKEVRALHKPGYVPSDRALALVQAAATHRGIKVTVVEAQTKAEVLDKLSAMEKRDTSKPADAGIQMMPVDVFLGATRDIINIAQGEKKLPLFLPITDFVKPTLPSALGGYGAPQHKCGELAASWVAPILKQSRETLAFKDAPDVALKWAVSRAAAVDLNIELPDIV